MTRTSRTSGKWTRYCSVRRVGDASAGLKFNSDWSRRGLKRQQPVESAHSKPNTLSQASDRPRSDAMSLPVCETSHDEPHLSLSARGGADHEDFSELASGACQRPGLSRLPGRINAPL